MWTVNWGPDLYLPFVLLFIYKIYFGAYIPLDYHKINRNKSHVRENISELISISLFIRIYAQNENMILQENIN